MTKLERVFIILILLSFALQYFDSAWANLIQLLVFPALSLLYGVFGFFALKLRPLRPGSILISISTGLLLAGAPIGALFRLQQWPQHSLYLLFGLIFSLAGLLVLLVLSMTQQGKRGAKPFRLLIIRNLAWFVFCLLLFAYPD